jgi:enamine deaminase RidA (YjgF/YER057c/UK114 family)
LRAANLAYGACDPRAVTPTGCIELIHTPELTHTPYAHAAVASDASRPIFTAGACPLDKSGATTAVGNVAGQAEAALSNLITALAAAGASLTDVVKTTVYVASHEREDMLLAWTVVSQAFGDHDVPSTLVGVAVLGYPDQLVEVEAIAALRAAGSGVAAFR